MYQIDWYRKSKTVVIFINQLREKWVLCSVILNNNWWSCVEIYSSRVMFVKELIKANNENVGARTKLKLLKYGGTSI